MDFSEGLKKIGEYFRGFNVIDGCATAVIEVPKHWKMFNTQEISIKYTTAIRKEGDFIYFACPVDSGTDSLFNAIFELINENKIMEQRQDLFKAKVKELQKLCLDKTMEELLHLEFVINLPKKETKRSGTKKKTEVKEEFSIEETTKESVLETDVELPEPEKVEVKKTTKKKKYDEEDEQIQPSSEVTEVVDSGSDELMDFLNENGIK